MATTEVGPSTINVLLPAARPETYNTVCRVAYEKETFPYSQTIEARSNVESGSTSLTPPKSVAVSSTVVSTTLDVSELPVEMSVARENTGMSLTGVT